MFNRHLAHVNRNVVHPNISLDPVECRQNTTVEIVELSNSSDDWDDTNTGNSYIYEPELHPWSYISHLYSDDDSYIINKGARERRRLNKSTEANPTCNQKQSTEQNYPSFYCFERDNSKYRNYNSYANRHVNCFTIPNHLGTSNTSSDDQNEDIDIIQCGDTNPNQDQCDMKKYDKVYFTQDVDTDKRTICIYSYKNRRTLSENNYVLTNIPSRDSSSYSSSTDEFELEPNQAATTQIAFIPRLNLNLTSTLPTVTEVIEPTKHSSCATENNPAQFNQTPRSSITKVINNEINYKSPTYQEQRNSADSVKEYCEPAVIINNSNRTEHIDSGRSYEKYEVKENNTLPLQKPHIKICLKRLTKDSEISDPIEKLEGNWICDSYITEHDPPIAYHLDLPQVNHQIPKKEMENTFLINNLPLLKPAEWNEYMSITDSAPSIELSIVSNKRSWFAKLLKCVKCFKKG